MIGHAIVSALMGQHLVLTALAIAFALLAIALRYVELLARLARF